MEPVPRKRHHEDDYDFVYALKRACKNYDQNVDLLKRCYKKGYSNEIIENIHASIKKLDSQINTIIFDEDQRILHAQRLAANFLNSILNPPAAPLAPQLPIIIDSINMKSLYKFRYSIHNGIVDIFFDKNMPMNVYRNKDMKELLACKLDYTEYVYDKKLTQVARDAIKQIKLAEYYIIAGSIEQFKDENLYIIKRLGATKIRFNYFTNSSRVLLYQSYDNCNTLFNYNLSYFFNTSYQQKISVFFYLKRFDLSKLRVNHEDMSIMLEL